MGVVLPMRAPNYVHDQVMITVKQNHDDDSMMLHEENLQGPSIRGRAPEIFFGGESEKLPFWGGNPKN